MAEDDAKPQAEEQATEEKPAGKKGKAGKKDKAPGGKKGLLLVIAAAVLVGVAGGGAGVAAAMFLNPATTEVTELDPEAPLVPSPDDKDAGNYEYYEFEALTVNLNVQRQDRYIKVAVMLAIPKSEKEKAFALIDKNKVFLKNWLMTYLAGHTLEQVQGKRNIVRMQREICDGFNEQLWPEAKPHIDHVLFKDFAIQ